MSLTNGPCAQGPGLIGIKSEFLTKSQPLQWKVAARGKALWLWAQLRGILPIRQTRNSSN